MKLLFLLAFGLLGHSALAQTNAILIKNALLFDGTGKEPQKGMDILIRNGLIKKTGKNLPTPRNTTIIDATGKTVIPGLIDMHGHLYAFGATQQEAYPPLYLAGGITTIFTPGEFEPELAWRLKDSISKGLRTGPDILSAGPYFNSRPADIPWMDNTASIDTINMLMKQWKGRLDGMKVYANISQEHFAHVMKYAREQNLVVTGHLGTLSARYAVEHGINGLEHGLLAMKDFGGNPLDFSSTICSTGDIDLNSAAVDSLMDLIIRHKVYLDPTNVLLDNVQVDFQPIIPNLEFYLSPGAIKYQQSLRESLPQYVNDTCVKKALAKQLAFNKKFFDKGGLLTAGTDPVSAELLPGFGIKREIMLFVKGGIPLAKAIRIASLNGAIALRIDKKTGSIEPGKQANLSIINGDITSDINLLTATELVIKHGQVYKSADLLQPLQGKIITGRFRRRPGHY